MKNYKYKYYIAVEGPTNTILSDTKVTAKQFYEMLKKAEDNLKRSIENFADEPDSQIKKLEFDYDYETCSRHLIRYDDACSSLWLTIYTAKDGYHFKK